MVIYGVLPFALPSREVQEIPQHMLHAQPLNVIVLSRLNIFGCDIFPRASLGPWKDYGFQPAFFTSLTLKTMEGEPGSKPTRSAVPKYRGIGRAMVAYGIKLPVDAGFNGDITLDAKTPELARHYERDFGAFRVPGRERDAAPRYLICDEAAQMFFSNVQKVWCILAQGLSGTEGIC